MMCEHEFVNDIGFFCKHCYKTMQEVDFEQRLAAANARIASYEQQFGEYCKWAKSDMDYWKQRADIANTEIEKLRREIAELRRGEGSAE